MDFDGEEFGRTRIDQLTSLVNRLESLKIDTGHARRFLCAGEWGLAFQEIYYAAVADGATYRSLEVELELLNNFLAKHDYYAAHLGYPLLSTTN